jgi:hypothetical protein
VTCCDAVCTDLRCLVHEMVELDKVVAETAGTGRLAVQVTPNERSNDRIFELVFKVQNVEGKSEVRRHAPGIPNVVDRTATADSLRIFFLLTLKFSPLIPKLHRETDDLLPFCLKQNCSR